MKGFLIFGVSLPDCTFIEDLENKQFLFRDEIYPLRVCEYQLMWV